MGTKRVGKIESGKFELDRQAFLSIYIKMAGPCCCATNVQAAKVLGIIFVVCSVLGCFGQQPDGSRISNIVGGIAGALISGILVYGAVKRSSTAILVWMILAIVQCIGFAAIAILAVVAMSVVAGAASGVTADVAVAGITAGVIVIVVYGGMILFVIWTIIVAKNARREIDEGVQ